MRSNEKPDDPNRRVFLVLGPWNHGGWAFGPGDQLGGEFGRVTFGGQKTGEFYRATIFAPFFEFYLKGKPGFDLRDTAAFRTGENQWYHYDVWPPKVGYSTRHAYLKANGVLSGAEPGGDYGQTAASYIANPADPVPYRHRPVQSTYARGRSGARGWWRISVS